MKRSDPAKAAKSAVDALTGQGKAFDGASLIETPSIREALRKAKAEYAAAQGKKLGGR